MKVLFAAGGTGGHINPALAVAGVIRERHPDAEILFVGTKDKMEAKLVPQAGYELRTSEISGFWRSFSPEAIKHNIGTVIKLLKSSSRVKKIIKDFKPDLVIGFGGYVSGPVLRMAAKMGIPTAIHEQNAFPGVTNKALAGKVDRVMLTAKQAEKYMKPKNPCVITGLPIRGDILKADADFARAELGLGIPAYGMGAYDPDRWEEIAEGQDACILAVGAMCKQAMDARAILMESGIKTKVVQCGCVTRMDGNMLKSLKDRGTPIFTLEENVLTGGFGMMVSAYCVQNDIPAPGYLFALRDEFIPHGKREVLLDRQGLSGEKIAARLAERIRL